MSKQLVASTKRKGDIPIGYDENIVLEEVEKAIKLYEENQDLDTGNMEVSEDMRSLPVWPPCKRLYGTRSYMY